MRFALIPSVTLWACNFWVSNHWFKMVNQSYSVVERVKLIYQCFSFHSVDEEYYIFPTFLGLFLSLQSSLHSKQFTLSYAESRGGSPSNVALNPAQHLVLYTSFCSLNNTTFGPRLISCRDHERFALILLIMHQFHRVSFCTTLRPRN